MNTTRRHRAARIGRLITTDDRSLAQKYGKMAGPFFRLDISNIRDEILFSAESQVNSEGYDINGLIVSDVTWSETDCEADEMTIIVQNPDLTLQDSQLFMEGNNLDLWIGYDGHTPEYIGRAIIVERDPTLPDAGMPTISIKAYDISHFMMEEGKAEVQREGTDWLIQPSATPPRPRNRCQPAEPATPVEERDADRVPDAPSTGGTAYDDGESTQTPDAVGMEWVEQQMDEEASANNRRTATPRALRPWSPSRRENNGKVWRGMSDSDIVATIYESYKIVPFIEATGERTGVGRTSATNRRRTVAPTEDLGADQFINDYEQGNDGWIPGNDRFAMGEETADSPPDTGQDFHPVANLEQEARDMERVNPTGSAAGLSIEEEGTGLDFQNIPIDPMPATEDECTPEPRDTSRRVVQKAGTTDWQFVKELAAKHNYIMFVFFHFQSRRWIGYFGPASNVMQPVIYTLRYNAGDETSLGNVRPHLSMKNQKTDIDLSYVDPHTRREQRMRVSLENLSSYTPEFRGDSPAAPVIRPLASGPQVTLTIFGSRISTVANRAFSSPEEARLWLMSWWMRYAAEFCTLEANTIIGLPELHARQKHRISGIGNSDGEYFFTSITHTIATGALYKTDFSAYRVVDIINRRATGNESSISTSGDQLGVPRDHSRTAQVSRL